MDSKKHSVIPDEVILNQPQVNLVPDHPSHLNKNKNKMW